MAVPAAAKSFKIRLILLESHLRRCCGIPHLIPFVFIAFMAFMAFMAFISLMVFMARMAFMAFISFMVLWPS